MSVGRLFRAGAFLALISWAGAAPADEVSDHGSEKADFSEVVEGAAALEGRIRSPCCWTQTLDIHGSPVSNELRREIRRRLKSGETQEAIEQDFVRRYGDRILAVPRGNPLKDVGVLLSLLFGGAGIAAGAMLLRWRRRALADRAAELDDERSAKPKKRARDTYDDKIDAELDDM